MLSCPAQGSGISIDMACASERPVSSSNSSALSKMAESLAPGVQMGKIFCRSAPYFSLASMLWRACIQLTLPRSVLISPLCAR